MTTAALNIEIREVKNKIPVASGFTKKTDYNAKISDTEKNSFTSSDYN